jgi:hypothetical protein
MSAPVAHVDHGLPSRTHRVGQDIDVDLTALEAVLLIESTVVLWGSVPIASLHKDIPQIEGSRDGVKPSCASGHSPRCSTSSLPSETETLEGQNFQRRIMQHDSKLSEKTTREGTKHDKIGIQVLN